MLEAELKEAMGAAPGDRGAERTGYWVGHYGRILVTRIGAPELRVRRDRDVRLFTDEPSRHVRRSASATMKPAPPDCSRAACAPIFDS